MPPNTAKILLIDDDPLVLMTLTEQLTSASYQTANAANGQEAWQLLILNPAEYNILILDRIMPEMDGMTLLTKMQEHPLLSKIPVIMLTGQAEREEVVAAVQKGVFDFLYKPLDTDLLLKVVERALAETQLF